MVEYKTIDVLEAARRRIRIVFDRFARVVVSISSGKDSTVLWRLALDEAERRDRTVEMFFLDQEAEYQATIDQVDILMRHPRVIPRWYQVPLRMTNATSHVEPFLRAWWPGEEWVRPHHPLAIVEMPGAPDRFYDFFPWFEDQHGASTAFLVGLRSKESLNRFRAVTSNPGCPGIPWSTRAASGFRFYPIYDWTFGDVWRFIADEHLPYNRVYGWMYARHGTNMSTMRVSNLIHENAFRALADLQEFEPDTYERMLRRLSGVHAAALYARESMILGTGELPTAFPSWRSFRDYLLVSTPGDGIERMRRRFAKHPTDENTCRQHVRQLLLNDHENNLPVRKGLSESARRVWWDRL